VALPWVRLDANIYTHDKVLWLVSQRDGYRALTAYLFSMAYAGGHATDGHIAKHVLPVIHATPKVATTLVDAGLWEYDEGGYRIKNWADRQELALISEMKRRNKRLAGVKSQCIQRHGPQCGCWKEGENV
jgi:hypothetical protein